VFEMIKRELRETTPNLAAWKLRAEEYGVPQRRTRVVLVGDNSGLVPMSPPTRVTKFGTTTDLFDTRPTVIGVKDVLSDLPPLEASEDGSHKQYLRAPNNAYQQLMRGHITAEQYLDTLR
jgi:DNA (cytosine-5)-methyltransferase 1